MKHWRVTHVTAEKHLMLKVCFQDGTQGYVHFKPSHLWGVFEPLKNPDFFNKVFIDHGAVTWPGELDLAPDAMHAAIQQHGEWVLP